MGAELSTEQAVYKTYLKGIVTLNMVQQTEYDCWRCRAVDMGAEQLSRVQDSAVYKTYLKAVADPALDAIAHSGPYTALVGHLRPQLGAAAAMSP